MEEWVSQRESGWWMRVDSVWERDDGVIMV